ncbi:MAG: hypothetical protein Q4G22_06290 [Paracoccus sp. (in: a-proteobacteria)]|nr:hypothetical protein [Paracoccus sp. (in: a-proteobacteria)]
MSRRPANDGIARYTGARTVFPHLRSDSASTDLRNLALRYVHLRLAPLVTSAP